MSSSSGVRHSARDMPIAMHCWHCQTAETLQTLENAERHMPKPTCDPNFIHPAPGWQNFLSLTISSRSTQCFGRTMAVFDGAVHLIRSPPFDSAAGHLFYYSAIHPAAVAQSVVLSTILESSGDVQLPTSVSLLDFEIWQKAVVHEQKRNKTMMKEMDMGTVCSILKVR